MDKMWDSVYKSLAEFIVYSLYVFNVTLDYQLSLNSFINSIQ